METPHMMKAEHASRALRRSLLRACAVVLAIGALMAATGCDKLKARDNLKKGVQAYMNARCEAAIDYFKKAVQLDRDLADARLYLSTANSQKDIPGAAT